MRTWLAHAALRIAAAGRVRMAGFAFATGLSAAAGAASAGAKPYGRGEDLLLRLDPWYGDPLWMASWVFWALALFVGGWAILRLKTHFETPSPGSLAMPIAGAVFAIALASAPWLIDAVVEGVSRGYRPPVWRGGGSAAPMAEDLLYRPGPSFQEVWALAAWVLYLLGIIVGGWAILRFKSHLENPQRGGLGQPVGGILVAVALASAPALIDAFVEGFGLDSDPGLRRPRFETGSPVPGGT